MTKDDLIKHVAYDPGTGGFVRLVNRPHSPIGSPADNKLDTHGYRVVRVCGKEFRAHRLAWFMAHGDWPTVDIDHINRDRTDNRLANLRLAKRGQNIANSRLSRASTSGLKGVSRYAATGRWAAAICIDGKKRHLGYFENKEEAGRAYIEAAGAAFGEFACRG